MSVIQATLEKSLSRATSSHKITPNAYVSTDSVYGVLAKISGACQMGLSTKEPTSGARSTCAVLQTRQSD